MDPWFNKKFCDRCGKSLAEGFSMSRFDTSALCFDCLEEERQHPDYQKAVDAELAALRSGNRNFEGIGWPGKKREGKIMATAKTNITVQLTGTDGNIFCVIGKVREALRRNGRSDLIKEITDYITSSSSYEEALCRVMEYVIVK